ncbi:MAG: PKD domain containing protein, partial [Marinimicrobia bacterium 46_43]
KYNLEYRWDWEDDGTWDTPYDTSKTETHSYDSTGDKTIRLEVRNSRNEVGTETETVHVQ